MLYSEDNKNLGKMEEYNQVYIKEEFSKDTIIKDENALCDKNNVLQEEFSYNHIYVKEEFSKTDTVEIKKEPCEEINNDLQQEYKFNFDIPIKSEPIYDDVKTNEDDYQQNFNDEFQSNEYDDKMIKLELADMLEVKIENIKEEDLDLEKKNKLSDNDDTSDEQKKELKEMTIKKRPADWLSQSLLYCPKCHKSEKKSRRDKFKSCNSCKVDFLYQCAMCKKNYKQSKRLSHHLRYYCTNEKQKFNCNQCLYSTQDPSILKDHIKYVHCKDQKINCLFCDKTFKSRRCLQSHVRYSHGKSILKCEHCSYTSKSKNTLIKHMNNHFKLSKHKQNELIIYDNQKISCEICHKRLKNRRTLKSHMRYSHENLMLECEYCLFMTKFRSYLNKHMNSFHPNINVTETLIKDKSKFINENITVLDKKDFKTYVIGYKVKPVEESKDQKDIHMICAYCKNEVCSEANLITHVMNNHQDDIKFNLN